ncbi:adenylate kinase [Frankia sp. CcI49]|uniref:adenylate kinase family protein n=1 Tax=unclassified Frankia TaxID=2632575 RepID=UPI0006CA2733|nr:MULTISPECIES: nucleoside monophosphate kinase [unclassified Frankia]KPM57461.1 adenylate kinase [Frankia sp. R43]ONH57932.1 adenylate kinase [Frankia sp. CcI49]
MRKFVIMGVQGSGKGTQAKLMADELDLVHISVGDVFRWNVQHHTKIGAQVRRIVASGHLVGDDLVESVVRARLTEHDWNYGFIIDGFPRNARQAEFFLESYDIDGVIYLDLPDEEVVRRVLARRLCSRCGLDYNLIASRPQVEDTCDVCGGALVTRSDDNPEALAVRLSEYHAKTRPVMDIFQRKEHVAVVDARRSVLEVQAEIREHFDLPSPRALATRPTGRAAGPPVDRMNGQPGDQPAAADRSAS